MPDESLLDLWLAGYTIRQIADRCGVTPSRTRDRLRLLRRALGISSVPLRQPGNPGGRYHRKLEAVRWA